jgi:chromosome partitioning protein
MGYKVLVIDADSSNSSTSYYFDEGIPFEEIARKSVFHVFMGGKVADNVIHTKFGVDLLHGDVRLNEFRSTDSLKRLKRALQGLDYNFAIADTSPNYDNIVCNVLTASDILLVPIQQDMFSYQALSYQFSKLEDLELDSLDIQVVFNMFLAPMNDNEDTYRNQITNLFLKDEIFSHFINPNRLSRNSVFRKYINNRNYEINSRAETRKAFEEVKGLIHSVLGIIVQEAV